MDAFNGGADFIRAVGHDSLTISEIGRPTSLAKTTLTGMLDRMESGFVRRTRHPEPQAGHRLHHR